MWVKCPVCQHVYDNIDPVRGGSAECPVCYERWENGGKYEVPENFDGDCLSYVKWLDLQSLLTRIRDGRIELEDGKQRLAALIKRYNKEHSYSVPHQRSAESFQPQPDFDITWKRRD